MTLSLTTRFLFSRKSPLPSIIDLTAIFINFYKILVLTSMFIWIDTFDIISF